MSQDFTATQQTVTSRDDAPVLGQKKPRGVKWKRLSVEYGYSSTLFLYKWSAPRSKASHGSEGGIRSQSCCKVSVEGEPDGRAGGRQGSVW